MGPVGCSPHPPVLHHSKRRREPTNQKRRGSIKRGLRRLFAACTLVSMLTPAVGTAVFAEAAGNGQSGMVDFDSV